MFNNEYLNCYFKIHDAAQKRLEQTQLDWVESVKSKEENNEVIGLDEDNLAFNRKQMLPFWKRLLASMSIADNFGGDEEDPDKSYKYILRIQKDGKCFNKKLHHVLFDEEVEQFYQEGDRRVFNLIHKVVSLEPLAQAVENPYGGGNSCLSLIKSNMQFLDPDEFVLNTKSFNVQTGR